MEQILALFDKEEPEIGQKLRKILSLPDSKERSEALSILSNECVLLIKAKKKNVVAERIKFGLEIIKLLK